MKQQVGLGSGMPERNRTINNAEYEFNELMRDNNSYRASIGGAGDGIAEPQNQHTPLFLRAFFDMVRSFR